MAKIIAECCQNHNGDLNLLKDMIWTAAEAGADYVKIQSILAEELTYRKRFEAGRVENGVTKVIKRPYQVEYDRLRPMDLCDEDHQWFVEECKKANVKPMTTIFTQPRIPFLSCLDWDAVKVASYDCASLPLVKNLSKHFNHLFISTGATQDEEIQTTAKELKDHSFSFIHCVTIYPTPLDEIHLARIDWLRKFSSSVGFSDHSLVERDGLKASIAAIFYGADVVERHFTILPADQSKDGPVSINPQQLKELATFANMPKADINDYIVSQVPEYEIMIGKSSRTLSHEELLNRDYYRGRFASKVDGQTVYNWEELP